MIHKHTPFRIHFAIGHISVWAQMIKPYNCLPLGAVRQLPAKRYRAVTIAQRWELVPLASVWGHSLQITIGSLAFYSHNVALIAVVVTCMHSHACTHRHTHTNKQYIHTQSMKCTHCMIQYVLTFKIRGEVVHVRSTVVTTPYHAGARIRYAESAI